MDLGGVGGRVWRGGSEDVRGSGNRSSVSGTVNGGGKVEKGGYMRVFSRCEDVMGGYMRFSERHREIRRRRLTH